MVVDKRNEVPVLVAPEAPLDEDAAVVPWDVPEELAVVVACAPLEEPAVVVLAGAPGAEMLCPLLIVLTFWHCDFEGAGCAAGVLGWPWWNVEVP